MNRYVILGISLLLTAKGFAVTNEESTANTIQSDFSAWSWEGIEALHNETQDASLGKLSSQGQNIIVDAHGTAVFTIPNGYWLRFINPENTLNANARLEQIQQKPSVWYSASNGLFIPAPLQFYSSARDQPVFGNKNTSSTTKKRKHNLSAQWIMIPPVEADLVVMLKNSNGQAMHWQVSRARPRDLGVADGISEIMSGENNDLTWHFENNPGKHVQLSQLNKNQHYKIDLQGPGKWKIETRLLQNVWQPWQRFININLKLNGQYWQDWRLHPSRDNSRTLKSEQCERLTSRPEALVISLPKGKHRLSFNAPQAMGLRVAKIEESPFLFQRNHPDKNSTAEPIPVNSAQAWPEYDDALLADYLSGYLKDAAMGLFEQEHVNKQLQQIKTLNLIEQRYQVWRPLSVSSIGLQQKSVWLMEAKQRSQQNNTERFILNDDGLDRSQKIILQLKPKQEVELQAPTKQLHHLLKLSFPVQDKPFEITLKNRHGHTAIWYWRPQLIDTSELDIVSVEDFSALALGSKANQANTFVSASGTIRFTHDDFPIRFSHNAKHDLWFSPFYRSSLSLSLDEETWLRALEQLGVPQMLSLLQQPSRLIEPPQTSSVSTASFSNLARLKDLVWQDWQPLRSWLLSYQQIWSQRLTLSKFEENPLRHEPLTNFIKRLSQQGDYALLSQTLKGVAVKDPDTLRQQQALNWLFDYYSDNQDISNLSAYHSWQFQLNPEQHLPILANWLLSQGQSEMAMRLFELDNMHSQNLPYQHTKLQQTWQQYQAVLSPLISVWHALWYQDWQQAKQASKKLSKNNPWKKFLAIMPNNANPEAWLHWISQSPKNDLHTAKPKGGALTIPLALSPTQSSGSVQLYQPQRQLYFQMALANPMSPVQYSVIGPIEMEVSVRLKHDYSNENEPIDDWIEIENNGDKRWFPIMNSQPSTGLTLLSNSELRVGSADTMTLSLGPGLHQLSFRPLTHSGLISAKVFSPPILSNAVKSIQNSAFLLRGVATEPSKFMTDTALDQSYLRANTLLENMDVIYLQECRANNAQAMLASENRPPVSWSSADLATQWQVEHSLSEPDEKLKVLTLKSSLGKYFGHVNELEQHLLNGLWHWQDAQSQQKLNWLAQANALAHPFLNHVNIRALVNKLNENYDFQPVEMIVASAGNRRANSSDNSEFMAEREALFWSGKSPKGERLYGHNQLGFIARFNNKTRIRLNLTQVHYPYHQAPAANVEVSLNDKTFKTISLSPLQQTVELHIPPGRQKVAIALTNPSKDHWLYVQADAYLNGKWQAILTPNYKRYDVATAQQPLELYFDKPSWVRIDEFRRAKVTHRYQYQAQAGTLELKPNKGEKQVMLRVLSLQEKRPSQSLHAFNFEKDSEVVEANALPILDLAKRTVEEFAISGARLNTIGNDTDGVYVQYQSRRDFDSDTTSNDTERFVEVGWRYRKKLDCLSCYWRSDLFAREHTKDNISTLGMHQWLQGAWPKSNWSWQMRQSLFVQPADSNPFRVSVNGILKHNHDINETMSHGHDMQLFARYLSEKNPTFLTDNDVYSNYQNQHRWGLRLEESIIGRPWLDSFWRVHARVASNELESSLKAEYVQAGIGWRQYFKPMEIGLDYHHRSYLKDENRASVIHKPVLGLQLNYWQGLHNGELLHWKLRLTNDLERSEYSVLLETSWNFLRGHRLKDYRPDETVFYDLHDRYIHQVDQSGSRNED